MKSKLFTLDSRDLLNGLIIAFLAAMIDGIIKIRGIILFSEKSCNQLTESAAHERTCSGSRDVEIINCYYTRRLKTGKMYFKVTDCYLL